MSEVQQLKKCSRCKCNILLETYFSKNRKGQYNKTCDRCRIRFKCPHCDHKCSENGNLQKHIKIVHDKIKDVKCPTCDYKCSITENLQQHIKAVHDKIKDFKCSIEGCDYRCSTNGNLQQHIKICVGNEVGSSGEVKIKKVLNEMKIDYEYNSSYEVKSDKGLLRWDFILKGDEPLFIEYDGRQHFEPVEHWGGQKAFEQTKKYDKLKDDYCNDNGYLLLRIPYTEYKNIETLVVDFIQENTNWGYE